MSTEESYFIWMPSYYMTIAMQIIGKNGSG